MTTYRDMAKAQIRVDEGSIPHAYPDSLGYLTIGVGRLIDERLGGGLSPDEIDYLLENDLSRAEATAKALFPSFMGLSDSRKAVLLSLAFQLGPTRLAGFQRFREAVSAGAWEQACAELKDSRWYDQVPERAERLIKQFREG